MDKRTLEEFTKDMLHKEVNALVDVLRTAKTNPKNSKANSEGMSDNNGKYIYYPQLWRRRNGDKPDSKDNKR